jgi:hypothetical protein
MSRWTMRLSKKHQTTAGGLGTPIKAKRLVFCNVLKLNLYEIFTKNIIGIEK